MKWTDVNEALFHWHRWQLSVTLITLEPFCFLKLRHWRKTVAWTCFWLRCIDHMRSHCVTVCENCRTLRSRTFWAPPRPPWPSPSCPSSSTSTWSRGCPPACCGHPWTTPSQRCEDRQDQQPSRRLQHGVSLSFPYSSLSAILCSYRTTSSVTIIIATIFNITLRCLFLFSILQYILYLFYVLFLFLISVDISTFYMLTLYSDYYMFIFFFLVLRSWRVFFLKPCTRSWVQSFLLWRVSSPFIKNAVKADGQPIRARHADPRLRSESLHFDP